MSRKRTRHQRESELDGVLASSAPLGHEGPSSSKRRRWLRSSTLDAVPKSQVTIAQLPELVLIHILGYLDEQDKASAARVCSKWRNLVFSASLWKDVSAYLRLDSLSSADFDNLRRRRIRDVTVLHCSRPVKMEELINTVPALEKFSAVCYEMTDRRMKCVFHSALSNMKNIYLMMTELNADVFKHFADHMPNLDTLELLGPCYEGMLSDIGVLKQVKRLLLCHSVAGILRIRSVPPKVVEMPHLSELVLWRVELDDGVLSYLKQAFPNLQKLDLELSSTVSETGIEHLAELTELRRLRVGSWHFSGPSWAPMSELDTLDTLDLLHFAVRSADVKFLGQLPALKKMAVNVGLLAEEGWRQVGRGFRKLETLAVSCFQTLSRTEAQCLGQLPCLEELHICEHSEHEANLQSLCQTLHKLKVLKLLNTSWLSDLALKDVADMPSLEHLELIATQAITDRGVRYLSKGRAPLRYLSLQRTRVTGKGLLYLAKGPLTLAWLHVQPLKGYVTGLAQLVEENPNLKIVEAKMTASVKRMLKSLRPGLTVERTIEADDIWLAQRKFWGERSYL